MTRYLAIYETEDDEPIEVPLEENDTILMSTVTGLFPSCTGLKYKAESGLLRCLRQSDNKILPPDSGWAEKKVYCIFPKDTKRKFTSDPENDNSDEISNKFKRLEGKKCTDLIILNLAWRTDENDLRRYFESFGDLVSVQIKRDPVTQNSKGYGFIRFSSYESQLLCLAERHYIDGRWCDVKIPMSKTEGDKQEVSRKIHVGRITEDITIEQLRSVFEQFGRVIDVFVPKPFRSFAFVTFDDPNIANNLIGKEIEITPSCISIIGSAVPKLPPANITNQKQIAVAMQAAACVAALNQNDWNSNNYKDEEPLHQSGRYPNQVAGPSGNFNSNNIFGANSATAAAAMLAAQYTRAHRQHQNHHNNR